MDRELRILILEDVPADAELEEHELRKAGLVFTSKVVDTREAFLKAVDEFSPDLILSDYDLSSFDGSAALKIAKETCPDVPFILVSGKVGEEFAIEKLKEGATDYVLKSNLKRLVPSVKRALQEAEEITERKRLRRVLQVSERLYRLLAENTNDMITRHLPDGTYLYVSPACRTLFGYEPEDLIGTNAFEQMHPEDVKRIISITQEAIRNGRSHIARYRHLTKAGKYIWVETTGKVIKNEEGEIEDIICVVRDITERKRAEEEILRAKRDWEDIFQAIGHPTIILDADHNIISANRATLNALGAHSEDEIKGKKCYELFHKTNEPPQGCPLERMLTSGNLETVEMEMEAFGGVYLVSCTPVLDEKGNIQKVIHIATDITERKQAEEALLNSKAFLDNVIEQSPYSICISDEKGTLIRLNQACRNLLHIRDDDVVGKYNLLKDNIVEEQGLMPLVKQVFEQGKTVRFNLEYDSSKLHLVLEDTVFLILDVSIFPIINSQGKVTNAVIQHIDITEKKRAEDSLKKSKKQIEMLLDSTAEAIYGIDLEGKCTFINRACLNLLGYAEENQVLGGNMHALIHSKYPDGSEYPKDKCKIYQAFKKGAGVNVDNEVFWKANGKSFPVEYWSYPVEEEGKVIGAVVTFLDITERRSAEELENQRHEQKLLIKEALLHLMQRQPEHLEELLKYITLLSAQILAVERVSIWFFNQQRSEIVCEALFLLSKHDHRKGLSLQIKKYPHYMEIFEVNRVVAVENVLSDSQMNELSEDYLKPYGIISKMDVPILRHGKIIGIICHEQLEARQWIYEEQEYAISLSQVITANLENIDRTKAEEELKKHQKELQKRIKDLEDFYAMAVSRELRMKDLKEEMAELKRRLEKYEKIED